MGNHRLAAIIIALLVLIFTVIVFLISPAQGQIAQSAQIRDGMLTVRWVQPQGYTFTCFYRYRAETAEEALITCFEPLGPGLNHDVWPLAVDIFARVRAGDTLIITTSVAQPNGALDVQTIARLPVTQYYYSQRFPVIFR